MRIEYVTNIEVFRPLGELWMQQQNADRFGLDITADDVLADARTVLATGGVCIGANLNGEWVGFMLVFVCKSFMGKQNFAIEKYWFAKPNAKMAGPLMLKAALVWAQNAGASHLIMSASNLASEMHDKVCEFYEKAGLKRFETSFITEV